MGSSGKHQIAQVRAEELRRWNNKAHTFGKLWEMGNTITALLAAITQIKTVTAPGNMVELKSRSCHLPVI